MAELDSTNMKLQKNLEKLTTTVLEWERFQVDRRKAEDALRRSDSFLYSVVENIPNMIFVKDAQELRFVRINRAGEELLGYRREELIGKNDYDFFIKREADFFTRKDREVLESGKLFDIPEEPIHTRNQGIRILHTKKIPISDEHGRPLYLLGISEDITEKKDLEKELLETSEREQRRIGQDLHDGLGQHLTGIALLSKVLAQRLAAKGFSEAEEATQIAGLVNQAIGQTRDLARLLYPVELEENGVISAINQLAFNTQKIFHVSCDLKCDENIVVNDHTLATNLYRIAQESVDNALKHSRAKRIQIEFFVSGGVASLVIKDNGIGMMPKAAKNNVGIGLVIMKRRAKLIGATLDFMPNPGGGTIMVCSFEYDAMAA